MNNHLLTKTLAIIFFAFISVPNASAQYTTEIYNTQICKGVKEKAIGRTADPANQIVSYHYLNKGEFHLTDINTVATQHFDIPNGMKINDVEVYGEEVYFCGTYNGKAIVGHFPLVAFIYGFYPETSPAPVYAPPALTSIAFEYFPIQEVEEMTKLEVYTSPIDGNVTVAAVGRMQNYIIDNNTGVFIITINGSIINYKYFTANADEYCIFQDVAVTDNFIVTTGDYGNAYNNTIIVSHIYQNNTTTLFANFYNESAGYTYPNYYHIEFLQGDDVAISSYIYNNPISYYCIPLHIYNVQCTTFTNSQIIPILEKTISNNEMLYFQEDSTLLLLHTNLYPDIYTGNSVIYNLQPYATSNYTANTIYCNDSSFNSLSRFQDFRFVATGELTNTLHSFFIHDKQGSFKSSCFNSDIQNIYKIATPSNISNFAPYMMSDSTFVKKIYPIVDETILEIKCQSK